MNRIPRVRLVLVLMFAAIGLALVVAYRDELRAISASGEVLEDIGPSLDKMRRAAAQASSPDAFVMDLWRTGLMPQRRFAVARVSDRATLIAEGWESLRPILLSASATRDTQMVQESLGTLGRFGDRSALAWASSGLTDPDPVLALAWLDYVDVLGATEQQADLAGLVASRDPEIASRATAVLADWTGEPWALPVDAAASRRTDLITRISEWYTKHPVEAPAGPIGASLPANATPIATPLVAESLNSSLVEIGADGVGATLLHFFSVRSATHEADIATLEALVGDGSKRLRVVHICVDRSESVYAYTPGKRPTTELIDVDLPAGVTIDLPTLGAAMDPAELSPVVSAIVSRLRIQSPVVIDADGQATRAYAAQVVPSFQWLSADGYVERRFEGSRPLHVFKSVVRTLSPGGAPPESMRPSPTPTDPLDPTAPIAPDPLSLDPE